MAATQRTKKKPARPTDRRNIWLLIITTLLVLGSVFMFTPPQEKINQGLDIQGGLSVVLTAKGADGAAVSNDDMEKSRANAKKMRLLFNQVVENGDDYRLIFGYTEDVSRFNYGFVHGSKTKIGNLIVGWNEESQTIVVVPTVPDLSGCGDPTYYRRSEILKAYRNKYPTDAFIIYPDKKSYIGINAYDWLEDESLYVYVSQEEELAAFTEFFLNRFATK